MIGGQKRIRQAHRWIGVILVLPLVVWGITGLLFHVKPGWVGAYEMLPYSRQASRLPEGILNPRQLAPDRKVARASYQNTTIGTIAHLTTDDETLLFDATTGAQLSPLSEENARKLAGATASMSSYFGERYGRITETRIAEPYVEVHFEGGAVIKVHRHRPELMQSGPDTDRINWLYRMHYLQWTGIASIDNVLGLVGIVLIWSLAFLGVWLALPRRRAVSSAGP